MKEKALQILDALLKETSVAAKWDASRFGGIKMVGTTNVGHVGEAFAVKILTELGYEAAQNPQKRGEWRTATS